MKNGIALTRIMSLLLAVCFFALLAPQKKAEAAPNVLFLGDTNCDGSVNTYDAVSILRYCVGIINLDFYGTLTADVTGDGCVDTSDASKLLNLLVSNTDILCPMEVLGDVNNPILYTDICYMNVDTSYSFILALSPYTADAVETPNNTVSFGQGYSVNLEHGKSYVFETQPSGNAKLDTVIYLLDASGNAFLADDNSGDAKFSRIEFYTWESGTYKVLVTGKNQNDIGSCRLVFGEHKYIDAEETPAATPAPTSTPTSTPTVTPSAAPTSQPVGGISFENQTVPTDDEAIQYKSGYNMKGTVEAHDAIVSVRVEIVNKNGDAEMQAERKINPSLNLQRYSLTDGGETSVNAQLKCASLSIGKKEFRLYCTIDNHPEALIFTSDFYVGATDKLLADNGYIGSASMSSTQRRHVLDYINSLDEDSIQGKVIQEAFAYLGTPYGNDPGELDCSWLVQKSYGNIGISIPRTSAEQARFCYELNGEIPYEDVTAGDLVFFRLNNHHCGRYREIHHVAFMLGAVDGITYFIEASSNRNRVVLRKAWNNASNYVIEFYSRPY